MITRSQVGLILEGGANRGVFTAGVLDCFQRKGLYFPYIVAVSVGACNAMDYVSKQCGRTRRCMIPQGENTPPIHWKNLFRHGTIIDLDLVFDQYPHHIVPFDFEAYTNCNAVCEYVVTNCETGQPEYLSEKDSWERFLKIGRASCSMPYFLRQVQIDGKNYLDGGISDPIPIRQARAKGYEKNVVILTREKGFQPREIQFERFLRNIYYREYPNLTRCLNNRIELYKSQLDDIERLEASNEVYVIRPEKVIANGFCMNEGKLREFYDQGYQIAEKEFEKIINFIQ